MAINHTEKTLPGFQQPGGPAVEAGVSGPRADVLKAPAAIKGKDAGHAVTTVCVVMAVSGDISLQMLASKEVV